MYCVVANAEEPVQVIKPCNDLWPDIETQLQRLKDLPRPLGLYPRRRYQSLHAAVETVDGMRRSTNRDHGIKHLVVASRCWLVGRRSALRDAMNACAQCIE